MLYTFPMGTTPLSSTSTQVSRAEPVAVQAYRLIRQAILQGQFSPGQRLIETELAAMLGVSRTPVREALSKLEVDGLVDLLPTGGLVVRNIENELVEIYGLRQRVEGYAANLAARRITADELAALEDVCSAALAALDSRGLEERAELNNTFHRRLTEASHSPRLIRLTNSYREYFLNARFLGLYDREAAVKQHRQHCEILEAVRQHRADRAERLVAEHFQSALAVIRAASGTGGTGSADTTG